MEKERKIIVMIVDSVALPRAIVNFFSDVNQRQSFLHKNASLPMLQFVFWYNRLLTFSPLPQSIAVIRQNMTVKTNYWVDLKGQTWFEEMKKHNKFALRKQPAVCCYLLVNKRNIKNVTVCRTAMHWRSPHTLQLLFNFDWPEMALSLRLSHSSDDRKKEGNVFLLKSCLKIDGMFECF